MDNWRSRWLILGVIFLSLMVLLVLTWANYSFSVENPGGNDFLVHWVGTRSLIIDGISPYSDEVALRIQRITYGRPARLGEHELRVAYPLYSISLFLPYALVPDYDLARAIWMTSLEVALVLITWISLKTIGWRPNIMLLTLLLLFTFTWYHSVRALINGNVVILITLLITVVFWEIKKGRDELAGIVLAIATIKPQVVAILVIFIFFWALSARRWKIIFWMIISLVVLSSGAALFVPNWPLQNLKEILRYPGYNPPGTPGAALETWFSGAGVVMGLGLTIILSSLLLVEWRQTIGKRYRWFLWTACVTLVSSQWIGIQTDPGNYIVLLPSLFLVFVGWKERSNSRSTLLIIGSMIILFVGLWALFLLTVGNGDQPQQHAIMFFPMPLFLLIGLFSVRRWAMRTSRGVS